MTRPKVLIIDDEPILHEMLALELVNKHGYWVDFARSNEEGLEKARQDKYEAVIYDASLDTSRMGDFPIVKSLRTVMGQEPLMVATSFYDAAEGECQRYFDGFMKKIGEDSVSKLRSLGLDI